jgi:predicted DNA-binding ribbon-helix-helix protein
MRDDGHLETRSVCLGDKQTTLALEPTIWRLMEQIAKQEMITLRDLVQQIEGLRGGHPRASAIRVYVLMYYASERNAERAAIALTASVKKIGLEASAAIPPPPGRAQGDLPRLAA